MTWQEVWLATKLWFYATASFYCLLVAWGILTGKFRPDIPTKGLAIDLKTNKWIDPNKQN